MKYIYYFCALAVAVTIGVIASKSRFGAAEHAISGNTNAPSNITTNVHALILPRIVPDSAQLFDPVNPPQCSLTSMQVSDVPGFTNKINNMIEWPKDYERPKPAPYTDADNYRLIADGMSYSDFGHGMGMRLIGKFIVDKCLNPSSEALIWDGKKESAVHTIIGKLTMFDYVFDSNQAIPLKFKITKTGYLYLEGNGTVTDLKTGTKYLLE